MDALISGGYYQLIVAMNSKTLKRSLQTKKSILLFTLAFLLTSKNLTLTILLKISKTQDESLNFLKNEEHLMLFF